MGRCWRGLAWGLVWGLLVAGSGLAEDLAVEDVVERIADPSTLGSWELVHPERGLQVMGSRIALYVDHVRDGEQKGALVVDIEVAKDASAAERQLTALRARAEKADGGVVEAVTGMGPGAFSVYNVAHADFGKRVAFRSGNVMVSVSPSPFSRQLAEDLRAALDAP